MDVQSDKFFEFNMRPSEDISTTGGASGPSNDDDDDDDNNNISTNYTKIAV